MGRLEEMMRSAGGNIAESMGAGAGAAPAPVTRNAPPSPRHAGIVRARDGAAIPVDRIVRDPAQPRAEFDEEALERLAASMKARGQLQPIRVRWDEGRGAYVILVGERRWRAARRAGLATVNAVIVDGPMEPGELLAIQLVENCLREDLKPVEQGRAFRTLMDANGWSARQLAGELAIERSAVDRALALLALPSEVQAQVDRGDLAATTACEIAKLHDPADEVVVAEVAVSGHLTRGEVVDLVEAVKAKRPAPARRPSPATFDLGDGVAVTIRWKRACPVGTVQALEKALVLARAAANPEVAA